VPSLLYTNFDCVGKVLPELRNKSAARVKGDKGFQLVSESLAAEMTQSERQSLNESQCRCEAAKATQIANEKKRVWRRCLAHGPRTRNITLTKGDSSGLSPAGTVARSPVEAAQNYDGSMESDFVLNETERILADYIQMFPPTSTPRLIPTSNRVPIVFAPTSHFIKHQ
jgi:hypothetical protein